MVCRRVLCRESPVGRCEQQRCRLESHVLRDVVAIGARENVAYAVLPALKRHIVIVIPRGALKLIQREPIGVELDKRVAACNGVIRVQPRYHLAIIAVALGDGGSLCIPAIRSYDALVASAGRHAQ